MINNKQQQGLTLLELLICVSIATVTLTIGVPFVRDSILQQRASAQVNQLILAIHHARSEAMTRAQVVTVCKSRDFTDCNGTWSDGYLIFVDDNVSGKVQKSADILQIFQPLHEGDVLTWQAFPSDQYLQMASNGFTRTQNGTFYYCPGNGDPRYARAVIVDQTGRTRVSQDLDGDGIHEDAKGVPLYCN